jgi:hypothetical protein
VRTVRSPLGSSLILVVLRTAGLRRSTSDA